MYRHIYINMVPTCLYLFIDVRHRRDTAAPPFGSWSAWIVLVIGASRYMAVIPSGVTSLILGRSLQTNVASKRFGGVCRR